MASGSSLPVHPMRGAQADAQPERLWRYLPLALLVTASVVVAPVLIVAAAFPRGGVPTAAVSAMATVAISILIATVESALWSRLARSRDLTFAELVLWGWLRRCWAERGLAQQRDLYESARKVGPAVSIDQLERLSTMLQARDPYTHGHSRRVARHAARIAAGMGLPDAEVAKIRTAATVHDVGKIYTPKEILRNPGRLTDAEFEIVKRHAVDGAGMLAMVGSPEIAAIVRHHHERIDGSGYPDGLCGDQIPLGARIIAVADTFDALTSNRPYRDANTHRRALRIIGAEAGVQLDAAAVAAFLSRYSSRRSIASLSLLAALPGRILMALQAASSTLGASASGAASILPALGASGLLGLAAVPALSHRAIDRSHARPRAAIGAIGDGPGQARSPQASSGSGIADARGGAGPRHVAQAPPTPAPAQTSAPQTPASTGDDAATGPTAATAAGSSAPPPSGASSSPSQEHEAASTGGRTQSGAAGLAQGASATAGDVAEAALSGTSQTIASTTEALAGPRPLPEAAGAALSGATQTLTGTTTSLISGLTQTIAR